MFKIASFNANSVRTRQGIILDWLQRERPDALCLQETKVEDKSFPEKEFINIGYNIIYKGQKSYNGVAIATPHPVERIHVEAGDEMFNQGEARFIAARIKGIDIINTYIPQGQDPKSEKFAGKLKWIKSLRNFFEAHYSPNSSLVWVGDFNVAPEPMDVHSPEKLYGHVGYHPEEHKALQYVKDWGLVDVFRLHVPEGGNYTFWDYRAPWALRRNLGWRVDHIWAPERMASSSTRAWIDKEPRFLEKPSDHTFIVAEFAEP